VLYLHHAAIVTPSQRIDDGAVLIGDARIVAVGDAACPPGAQVIDASGLFLAPGFVDLQLNGAFGLDFTAAPETIWDVAARLPQYGVTAFLPTIVTSPPEISEAAQAALLKGAPSGVVGATPLGLHVEGPFLNPAKRGAHNPNYLRLPDVKAVEDWWPDRGVRLVTLAPELPGALEMIRCLAERGVIVSAAHSMATAEEAQAGFEAGLRYGTHLFNTMPALDPRAPGLAGALLADGRVSVGLIADGIHLHPAVVALTWQAKGPHRLNLVTDAMAALGMPSGHYQLGDFEVTVDASSARLADGRLAGSILSLDQAVRNLIAFTGCSISDALSTVTTTPARMLGLSHGRGQIAPGFIADLVLLTRDLRVAAAMVSGRIVFNREDAKNAKS